MLIAVLSAKAQQPRADSLPRVATPVSHQPGHPYKRRTVSRTDIQVLFAYYTQDGDHSAITGGIGTEWLHVYSPEFTLTHRPDSNRTLALNGGIDIITSASMDNIDFVKSSASRISDRFHMTPSYSYLLPGTRTRLSADAGFSLESAYLSFPVGASVTHANRSGSRQISASLQCYFDDLRFGRLIGERLQLIYPVELRDTSWFNIYRRYSYNLDFAFYQVVNPRLQFAVYPGLVFQKGLLSTTYHRVYFSDSVTEKVENLPRERWKFPIGTQWNYFFGRRVILRAYYRYYRDSWGIIAHTVQLETPVKISPVLTLTPLLRFHTQTGASYFRPYRQHNVKEIYYTSDYDLSALNSYKAGLTVRYAPQNALAHHYFFDDLSLRYSYYRRSDGLYAHILSLLLDVHHLGHQAPATFNPE